MVSVVTQAYVEGVSTRRVDDLVRSLGCDGISKSQVSRICAELDAVVESFLERPLDSGPYRYLWLDALTRPVREEGRVVQVSVVVATAVNASGKRELLGINVGTSEDGAFWLAFLRELVARGLTGVELVTSDAHQGLGDAIATVFAGASWQHCRTHCELAPTIGRAPRPDLRMQHTLYLFADTNLFIQCRALEEIDWSAWSEFTEVHLIVSRPVQREIDEQKNRGNERVGRRARKAYERFRAIITSDKNHAVVRESAPRVELFLAGPAQPAAELSDVLDYTRPDDELVGYMAEYRKQHEGSDVRLLTHDSGPMMAAKSQDLPFVPIPDSWLLAPEPSKAEKENSQLRKQIARLQAGPDFDVAFMDQAREQIHELRAVHHVPVTLPDRELTALMQELKKRAPPLGWLTRPDAYENSLTECEQVLRRVHDEMQVESEGVPVEIAVTNTGTRPGKDVLLAISAKGNFRIRPHRAEWSFYADSNRERTYLPSPPSLLDMPLYTSGLLGSQQSGGERRDPNGFYCKGGLPHDPVDSYSLECAQWRHGAGAESFRCEIFVSHTVAEIEGALECVIHAENLSEPMSAVLPVRIEVRNASVSVADRAWGLVRAVNSGS